MIEYYGTSNQLKLYSKGIHYISFDVYITNDSSNRINISNFDSINPHLTYEFKKVL